MLLLDDGTVVHSASDLSIAATCEFALLRELDGRLGRAAPVRPAEDAMLERLARLGDRHEREVLAGLRRRLGRWDPSTGRGVLELTRPTGVTGADPAALAAAHDRTLAALRGGADAVYQGCLFDGRFLGFPDLLVRTDAGYTVVDAKLARRATVPALLQVAAYAAALRTAGVPLSDEVHLALGDRTSTDHRLDDLLPIHHLRRDRLERILATHLADDGPVAWGDERYRACLRCDVCVPELAARRDVLGVAGVRGAQRAALAAAGIVTVDALAESEGDVAGVGARVLAGLRTQARLQVAATPGAPPPVDLVAPEVVGQLPLPDEGDLFFDFEGDPLWTDDAGQAGLEYLFGMLEAPDAGTDPSAAPLPPGFRPLWAHDRAAERQALLDFLDLVEARRATHPGMHVYHYAAYEKAALLRLAARYGVGEERVDTLLRDGVLVDLYRVVRGALRVGSPSYSLKKLEPLYMPAARTGEVQTAGESVVAYAEACDVRDAGRWDEWTERLGRIAEYNAYDCLSTLRLRDWLLARAAEVGVTPGRVAAAPPTDRAGTEIGRGAERRAGEAAVAARLLAFAGGPTSAERTPDQQALALLAAAVGYHRREEKPYWWAHFDRLVSDPAEWTDRRGTFVVERADVATGWHLPPRARTVRRVLRLVGRLEPGATIAPGAEVCAVYDPPVPDGLVVAADGGRGWTDKVQVTAVAAEGDGAAARDVVVVTERAGQGQPGHDALPMALGPGRPPDASGIAAAVRRLAEQVADHLELVGVVDLPDHPALDLLRRRPPGTGPDGLPPGTDAAAITAALLDLPDDDGRCLAVQGPPGTGKTRTGARVIATLVERGWRIGVVAQSHAVVENLLDAVAAAGVPRERLGKKPNGPARPDAPWTWLAADRFGAFHAAQTGGYVVGGTAWDLTHPGRLPDRPLDLVVVDEAGQFALADAVAVATAGRRLLLLGDPQQLPQVTQGSHPEPVDRSALGWLAAGHRTLPAGLGYFLAQTWRMHPALCDAVSRLSYEGRLTAMPAAAQRRLDGVPPGVGCVLVEHEGNAVASAEEAAVVVEQVRAVLGRTWHDPAAAPTERPLEQRDVVVVAPYNAQVWTVRRALTDAGLPDVRVGTVDRFQGQEAVVVVVTMTASSPADVPRGMGFLLDRNRVNVAVSRARWRAVVVRSARLTDDVPPTPEALAELGAFVGLCAAGGVLG